MWVVSERMRANGSDSFWSRLKLPLFLAQSVAISDMMVIMKSRLGENDYLVNILLSPFQKAQKPFSPDITSSRALVLTLLLYTN